MIWVTTENKMIIAQTCSLAIFHSLFRLQTTNWYIPFAIWYNMHKYHDIWNGSF